MRRLPAVLGLMALCLCACVSQAPTAPAPVTATVSRTAPATVTRTPRPSVTATRRPSATLTAPPTHTPTPAPTFTAAPTGAASAVPPSPTPTPTGGHWTSLPVFQTASPAMREVYARGLAQGNNPRAFSKVGDCESSPEWFLGDFDRGPRYYRLGEYTYLDGVIQQFAGSFARTSLAARAGFSTGSMLDPNWVDPTECQRQETPLACEYRVHRPSLVFIMLGTNDVYHLDVFEANLRAILEYSLAQGVVPILSTKADNLEGDGRVNALVAQLAQEYQVPLWNFWLAIQPLPDHGLQPDGAHITFKPNRFDDPFAMAFGWPWRNLTALQTLDAVWRALR